MLLFQFIGERWFRTEAVMAAVLFPKNDGITGIVSIFISLSLQVRRSRWNHFTPQVSTELC
jgi:hypothetical protein